MRGPWLPAALVLLAGCGGLRAGAGNESIPKVARVICGEEGTRVETPVVRPQRDGVHLLVENRTATDLGISMRWGSGEGGGDNADRGTSEIVWPIPPGGVETVCSGDEGIPDEGWPSFEVVDPKGLFVSPELDCGWQGISVGHGDYGEDARGDPRNPVLIAAERFAPLEPGDEVQRAGYPEAEYPLVRLVRDGRVAEVVEYTRDSADGWLETEHRKCS